MTVHVEYDYKNSIKFKCLLIIGAILYQYDSFPLKELLDKELKLLSLFFFKKI